MKTTTSLFLTTLIITLILIFSCNNNTKQNIKNKETDMMIWKSEFPLDTNIHFNRGWDAAYAYNWICPASFIEDNYYSTDTSTYVSKNKEAKLLWFTESHYNPDDLDLPKIKSILDDKMLSIKQRKHDLAKNFKVIKSAFKYGDNKVFKNFPRLQFLGTKGDMEVVWVIELSELPVSGEWIFKNMYFEYPKEKREYYQPIGIEMLNSFGLEHL